MPYFMMGIIGNYSKEEAVVVVAQEVVEEGAAQVVVTEEEEAAQVAVMEAEAVVEERLHKHSVQLQNHFQSHRNRHQKLQEAADLAFQLRHRLVSL